ncbi:Zn-dependent hydrolase [Paenibacillus solisilvae]|uniref:Zn-dependent hydrolase n=1 Tax=Paenibacillus solisilvae TaxID=2486751 RepID=A0ABW0W9E4_9BACL
MRELRIQPERLENQLQKLGSFGRNEQGGIDRTTFTPSELAAREWLKSELRRAGLHVRIDPAANIWGRRDGGDHSLPVIAFGSHIDTVPNGGMYDGALGVLIALEVMRTLIDNDAAIRHPLELVSFSAEEPNPFGLSTLGSRAAAGKLSRSDLEGVTDNEGRLLTEALAAAGGDPDKFEKARLDPAWLSAFLEVHIEQGKRLLERNIAVGIVTSITGIYREVVTVHGEANHAGTTRMEDRCDALMAASELMLAFEEICRNHPSGEVVGTVGCISNFPNAANIIPAKVVFILEARGNSELEIQKVMEAWSLRAEVIGVKRKIRIERRLMLNQAPVPMEQTVIGVCRQKVDELGYDSLFLGSMAGHDAAHMSALTRTGMLFVPSLEGKSHCLEERSRMDDIEKAANVLLHVILELDCTLDQ